MRHRLRHRIIAAARAAGSRRGEDSAAQRRALIGIGHAHGHMQHICINLHRHTVFAADAAGGKEVLHRHAMRAEVIHNHARAKCRGLDHRAIDLLRAGLQRHAQHEPLQIVIGQDAAVAVPPIQHHQSALAGAQGLGMAGQILLDMHAARFRFIIIFFRHHLMGKPRKAVAYAALSGFIAIAAGQDAVRHRAADARHGALLLSQAQMTGGSTQDGQHLPWAGNAHRRRAYMRVNMRNSHRRASNHSQPARHGLRYTARARAKRRYGRFEFILHHRAQTRIQGCEIILRRVCVISFIIEGLISGDAAAAGAATRKQINQIIPRLHPLVHGMIDFGIFIQHLPEFGKRPLAGHLAAVHVQPALAALTRDAGHLVGIALGGVMLPQLYISVWPVLILRQQTQRRAFSIHRHGGRGGKIHADADDVLRPYA